MTIRNIFILLSIALLTIIGSSQLYSQVKTSGHDTTTIQSNELSKKHNAELSKTGLKLESLGYVNINDLDATIAVEMIYATADNFMGEVLYNDLVEAYLLPEAAQKLVRAHQLLKEKHPEYRFVVYDAARPMSVQKRMWNVAMKNGWSSSYVANPANGGGLHNYGAAVDITILDENGEPLSMGTPFDFFGEEAHTDKEPELVKNGKITQEEMLNRRLLRNVMKEAGFTSISSEWWHFNHCSRNVAKQKYKLIE